MTVPLLRKWRPGCVFHRFKGLGWQFFIYPHPDNNPIVIVSYWAKKWYLELHRWSWSADHGFRTRPRWHS